MYKKQSNIKTAPFQDYNGRRAGYITWEAHLEAYAGYARQFGFHQPPEEIAERGGFGANELDVYFPDWKKYIIETI